jgi:hypothetical protein
MPPSRTFGWHSSFEAFCHSKANVVRDSLKAFIKDASKSQIRAWDDSIPLLQGQENLIIQKKPEASSYDNILEYQLPLESRRPDVVLLGNGAIVVVELKGKAYPTQADMDQVAAYARDLRCYHKECANRPVYPILMLTFKQGPFEERDGIYITGPSELHNLCRELVERMKAEPVTSEAFLSYDAYSPLPTLVQAARELFETRELRNVWKARAVTDPAVNRILEICKEAARTKTRRLILLTGIPGSGKTLVGLRVVHDKSLEKLIIERASGKPSVPGVFLSGNGPLVEVLQFILKGKTFVRGVKDYVKHYGKSTNAIPNEHLIIFDEAQRAWDADRVAYKHDQTEWDSDVVKSEPEYFIDFAERVPEWCVVLGLIGSGQEINAGEEGGLILWKWAIERCGKPKDWIVHGPSNALSDFEGSKISVQEDNVLNLDTELRNHLVPEVHHFVDAFLNGKDPESCKRIIKKLQNGPITMYVTRDLRIAKKYIMDRYEGIREARYGLIASSRDKMLVKYGIMNDYQSVKKVKLGPWFNNGPESPWSCCNLMTVITEFKIQGLELDMSLLCWGTDLIWKDNGWTIDKARGFEEGVKIKDPHNLRLNSYRVLLTRGRDGTVVYVPPEEILDATYQQMLSCGFKLIDE